MNNKEPHRLLFLTTTRHNDYRRQKTQQILLSTRKMLENSTLFVFQHADQQNVSKRTSILLY